MCVLVHISVSVSQRPSLGTQAFYSRRTVTVKAVWPDTHPFRTSLQCFVAVVGAPGVRADAAERRLFVPSLLVHPGGSM